MVDEIGMQGPPVAIALDAMGSDAGPAEAVSAAAWLSRKRRDLEILLVGDEARLSPLLLAQQYDPARLVVIHAPDVVRQDDSARSVLERPGSSLMVAARLVAEGRAQGLVSAGNSGACVRAADHVIGRLPGVRRAALAAVYPTEQRHGPRDDPFALILDVGCTLTASARDLATFAAMGAAYSRAISGIQSPSVALLSNGAEAHKGLPEIVAAHPLLAQLPGMDFKGNVEGLDIPRGSVDVVVTSGFLGNVVLKMLEGIYEVARSLARSAQHSGNVGVRMGLAMMAPGLRSIRKLVDWEEYGGAPILGLKQVVIKAHGRSTARALGNACKVAAKAARADVPALIAETVASLPSEPAEPVAGAGEAP